MEGQYEVVVSATGETDAIMREADATAIPEWSGGRVFCVPEDRINELIDALLERRFEGYNPTNREHSGLRVAIKARIFGLDDETVAFDAELADLFSSGRYCFAGSSPDGGAGAGGEGVAS